MVICKIKGTIPAAERDKIDKYLKDAFPNEKVLLINSDLVELVFVNEGKKRCAYCATLNQPEKTVCESCGAPL